MEGIVKRLYKILKQCTLVLLGLFSIACNNSTVNRDDQRNAGKKVAKDVELPIIANERCLCSLTSTVEGEAFRLEILNRHSEPIPLKDIYVGIEPTEAYRNKINSMCGFIIWKTLHEDGGYVFKDHRGSLLIPDGGIKVNDQPIFEASDYHIPPQGKVVLLVVEDVEDSDFWKGVPITFQLKYQEEVFRTRIAYP